MKSKQIALCAVVALLVAAFAMNTAPAGARKGLGRRVAKLEKSVKQLNYLVNCFRAAGITSFGSGQAGEYGYLYGGISDEYMTTSALDFDNNRPHIWAVTAQSRCVSPRSGSQSKGIDALRLAPSLGKTKTDY